MVGSHKDDDIGDAIPKLGRFGSIGAEMESQGRRLIGLETSE